MGNFKIDEIISDCMDMVTAIKETGSLRIAFVKGCVRAMWEVSVYEEIGSLSGIKKRLCDIGEIDVDKLSMVLRDITEEWRKVMEERPSAEVITFP